MCCKKRHFYTAIFVFLLVSVVIAAMILFSNSSQKITVKSKADEPIKTFTLDSLFANFPVNSIDTINIVPRENNSYLEIVTKGKDYWIRTVPNDTYWRTGQQFDEGSWDDFGGIKNSPVNNNQKVTSAVFDDWQIITYGNKQSIRRISEKKFRTPTALYTLPTDSTKQIPNSTKIPLPTENLDGMTIFKYPSGFGSLSGKTAMTVFKDNRYWWTGDIYSASGFTLTGTLTCNTTADTANDNCVKLPYGKIDSVSTFFYQNQATNVYTVGNKALIQFPYNQPPKEIAIDVGTKVTVQNYTNIVNSINPMMYGYAIGWPFLQTNYDDRFSLSTFTDQRFIKSLNDEMAKPSFFYYPGGSWSDIYHWYWAIGPKIKRQFQVLFVSRQPLPTTFGVTEFAKLMEQTGHEGMWALNYGNSTEGEIKALAEFMLAPVPTNPPMPPCPAPISCWGTEDWRVRHASTTQSEITPLTIPTNEPYKTMFSTFKINLEPGDNTSTSFSPDYVRYLRSKYDGENGINTSFEFLKDEDPISGYGFLYNQVPGAPTPIIKDVSRYKPRITPLPNGKKLSQNVINVYEDKKEMIRIGSLNKEEDGEWMIIDKINFTTGEITVRRSKPQKSFPAGSAITTYEYQIDRISQDPNYAGYFAWLRAQPGYGEHPEPYKLKYFQLANEPYYMGQYNEQTASGCPPWHVCSPGKNNVANYFTWYQKTRKILKDVNPDVRVGINVFGGNGFNGQAAQIAQSFSDAGDWNRYLFDRLVAPQRDAKSTIQNMEQWKTNGVEFIAPHDYYTFQWTQPQVQSSAEYFQKSKVADSYGGITFFAQKVFNDIYFFARMFNGQIPNEPPTLELPTNIAKKLGAEILMTEWGINYQEHYIDWWRQYAGEGPHPNLSGRWADSLATAGVISSLSKMPNVHGACYWHIYTPGVLGAVNSRDVQAPFDYNTKYTNSTDFINKTIYTETDPQKTCMWRTSIFLSREFTGDIINTTQTGGYKIGTIGSNATNNRDTYPLEVSTARQKNGQTKLLIVNRSLTQTAFTLTTPSISKTYTIKTMLSDDYDTVGCREQSSVVTGPVITIPGASISILTLSQ